MENFKVGDEVIITDPSAYKNGLPFLFKGKTTIIEERFVSGDYSCIINDQYWLVNPKQIEHKSNFIKHVNNNYII